MNHTVPAGTQLHLRQSTEELGRCGHIKRMSLLRNHQPKVRAQASWGNPRHPECARGHVGPLPRTPPAESQQVGVWRGRPAAAQPHLRASRAEQFLPGPTVKAQDSTWAEKPSRTHHGRTHPSLTKRSTDRVGTKQWEQIKWQQRRHVCPQNKMNRK